MIKICWIQHASEWPLVEQVADYLQKKGAKVKFVCKNLDIHKQYLKDGFESYFISEIFNEKKQLSKKTLENFDFKYGPPGIKSICDSDLHLACFFGDNQAKKEQLVGQAYKFWEKFFDKHKINYVITRETACFAPRTAYNVARHRDIPIAQMVGGPGSDYFSMSDMGETYAWKELPKALASGPEILTSRQKEMVYSFTRKRIAKPDKVMAIRFVPYSLAKIIRSLIGRKRRDTATNRKKDPVTIAALRYGRYKLLKRAAWKYITQNFFHYDNPEDEKFVYFPLFSSGEALNLAHVHYWANNQLSLIKEVASSLPAGFWLYVKEHPVDPGDFLFSELRRLQKIPNVKIIHPSVLSQELIEKSQAVVVVGGAVGWEAFLSRKPVICLASPYYSYSSLVYKVKSISQLSDILWQAIRQGSKIYDSHKDEWLRFIYSVITTCGKGAIVRLKPPYGFPTDPENSKKIAEFIFCKIKRDLGI